MQVNFNFFQPNNNFLNVNRINSDLNNHHTGVNSTNADKNTDKVSVSPKGKMMSAIENLMKQKQSVTDQRNELISNTIKDGNDLKSIEPQLESLDEQLKNIDEQIAQMNMQEAKKAVEQAGEKKSNHSNKNKTEEEIEMEKLNRISSASLDIKQAEVVASVKSKADGEIRVEKVEIKNGKIQIEALQSKGANVAEMVDHAKEVIKGKEENVSKLLEHATSIDFSQGKEINDAMTKIEENNTNEQTGEKVES